MCLTLGVWLSDRAYACDRDTSATKGMGRELSVSGVRTVPWALLQAPGSHDTLCQSPVRIWRPSATCGSQSVLGLGPQEGASQVRVTFFKTAYVIEN